MKVAAGLIMRNGRYLITKRKHEAHLGGYWEFPGGKCEVKETLEECLRRELHEELGVLISDPLPFHRLSHEYSGTNVELHFFTCHIIEGEVRALGCQEFKWVYPVELSNYTFPPADAVLIAMIQQQGNYISNTDKEE